MFIVTALRNVVTAFCSVDHRDRGPQILIVCGIFGGLSLLVTLLRLYDRPPFTIAFGLDDVLLVLSEVSYVNIKYHVDADSNVAGISSDGNTSLCL